MNKYILPLSLLIFIILSCVSKNEQYYYDAEMYYMKKNYQQAIQLYDKYFNSNPNFKKNWLNWNPIYERALTAKGNAYFKLGKYEEAIRVYNQSLNFANVITANNDANYFNSGFAQFKLGNYQQALAFFDKYDDKKFGIQETLILKADIFSSQAQYDTALYLIKKCLELNPNNGNALIRNMDLWIKLSHSDSAKTLFENSIETTGDISAGLFTNNISILNTHFVNELLKQDSLLFFCSKANSAIRDSDFKGALHALQDALRIDPNSNTILTKTGDVFQQLDVVDSAIVCYNKVLEQDSMYVDALWKKGNALLRKEDSNSARGLYELVLELEPENLFAKTALILMKD